MLHISQIDGIGILTQIERRQLTATVTMLAKKFLPEKCAYRLDSLFHLDILKGIGEQLLNNEEINDLKHICRHCRLLRLCELYNN